MARGDRLVTDRRLTGCGPTYMHYGIDMGDGTVVHTRPHRFERLWRGGSVVRTSVAEFAAGEPVRVVNEPPAAFTPEEIAARAEKHVGREGYSPVIDNCEHFATWCATGMRQSRQIDIIASRVGRVAGRASVVASSRLAQSRVSRAVLHTAARRTAVGGLPAMLVAEGVSLWVEWKAHRAGHDEQTSRRAGDAAGLAMTAATFAVAGAAGGPVGVLLGAVTGATAWAGGSWTTKAAGWAGGRVVSGVTSLSGRLRQPA